MKLTEFIVEKVDDSQTGNGAYMLLLKEKDSEDPYFLPVIIGPAEAQSIIFGLDKNLHTKRPLTHDLFAEVLKSLGLKVSKVVISKLDQGIFYAVLVLEKEGETYEFDSRTSDAVAMAVRFDAPIYASEQVVREAAVRLKQRTDEHEANETGNVPEDESQEELERLLNEIFSDNPQEMPEELVKLLDSLNDFIKKFLGEEIVTGPPTEEELQKMLDKAIEQEDYETAAKLRDLIKKLKKNKPEKPGKDPQEGEQND